MDTLCLQKQQELGRWFIAKDMNCDGAFTISDIPLLSEWVVYLPGDLLLLFLMGRFPEIAAFLELTPASFGGWISLGISIIAWLFVCGLITVFCLALDLLLEKTGSG